MTYRDLLVSLMIIVFGAILLLLNCGGPAPVEDAPPSPTATPLLVVIETATITPTVRVVAEIDHVATATSSPTRTPMPTWTPTSTATPTATEQPLPKELPRAGGG